MVSISANLGIISRLLLDLDDVGRVGGMRQARNVRRSHPPTAQRLRHEHFTASRREHGYVHRDWIRDTAHAAAFSWRFVTIKMTSCLIERCIAQSRDERERGGSTSI